VLNPVGMARNLWSHRRLTWLIAKRNIQIRYRQTKLGAFWVIATPLATMIVYSVVFGYILGSKFEQKPGSTAGRFDFPLNLLCGMLIYELFAGAVRRSPSIVLENPNYVKRVVFPLEIFTPAILIENLFNMFIGYALWIAGYLLLGNQPPSATWLYFPLIVLPVALWGAGLSWLAAAAGVVFRDLGQAVYIFLNLFFFATPIIYDFNRIEYVWLREALELNPLGHAVTDARRIFMQGVAPEFGWLAISTGLGAALTLFGYAVFMRAKRIFPDVI
jgi:lipopolysaccharide transport system permease protein